jgi:hypothetical protein
MNTALSHGNSPVERAMKKIVILFVLFALAQPLYAAKAPDWVNGSSEKYSEKVYLIGLGVGDTLDGARSSARAEIAKVFKSRIVQLGKETRSERNSQKGSSSQFAMRQDTALSTSVSTDELLQGVEIAETWRNDKSKTYYALAVLNKQKTRQALMQQITDQEEIIAGRLSRAKRAVSALDKLRALNSGLEAMNRKDELIARKRVLDPVVVADISTGTTRADIEQQRADVVEKIRFVLQTDDTPNLAARLTAKITSMGFTTVPEVADPKTGDIIQLIVRAKTSINLVDRNNPHWKFYGWQGTVSIVDAADLKRVIASAVREGQASHVTANAAKAKAVSEVVRAVADAAEHEIANYLFGKPR